MIKTFPQPLDEPLAEWLTIDVPTAEKLLGHNENNRNKRPPHIEGLSHDMAGGNWVLNGETIKIAYNGRLLDGQNRMEGVVLSNTPQRFLVVMGLPDLAQDTVDTGIKRTFSDVLKIKGYGNHVVLAAVVRQTLMWERGARRNIGHGKIMPTHTELMGHLRSHPELIEVTRYASWISSHFSALPKSVLGLTVWLFDHVGEEGEREDFFVRLIEGTNMEKAHPIMVLRRLLLQREKTTTIRLLPEMKLALTIKAWNAYREGREVELLMWRAGGKRPEPFPEPR